MLRVLYFLFIISQLTFAQNLVHNPSFEHYYSCPQTYNGTKSQREIAPFWTSPSYGTPDLFNTCSDKMGERNITGITKPFDGQGFAGIILWSADVGFREYLRGELIKPLEKGVIYQISFRHKLSTYSNNSCDRIGFSFTPNDVFVKHDQTLKTESKQVIKPKPFTPLSGTWELVNEQYMAKGGEKYITIGNFSTNELTTHFHLYWQKPIVEMLNNKAYYYIDDVNIHEVKAFKNPIMFHVDTIYKFKDLTFETASYIIDSSSYIELNQLAIFLQNNPKIAIQIDGHTDHVGSASYNLDLSQKRANSVRRYLITKGIIQKRISVKGFGDTKPISKDNNLNRRVECTFSLN